MTALTRRALLAGSAAASLLDAGYPVKGVYGESAMEKFASVQPDLLIDTCWDDKTLWYVPAKDLKQVESMAPTLGIRSVGYDLEQLTKLGVRLVDVKAPGNDTRPTSSCSTPACRSRRPPPGRTCPR